MIIKIELLNDIRCTEILRESKGRLENDNTDRVHLGTDIGVHSSEANREKVYGSIRNALLYGEPVPGEPSIPCIKKPHQGKPHTQ